MQWSNEIWTAVIIAFFVGVAIGYLILMTTNANAKKQQKLEVELNAATQQITQQKQQLEQHFEQSAKLLSTMVEDYKKLYNHLAQSSQTLLPETTAKLEFFQQAQLEGDILQETEPTTPTTQAQDESLTESEENIVETKQKEEKNQPKDYTEGSSGILKS